MKKTLSFLVASFIAAFKLIIRFTVRSVLGWTDGKVHVPEYRSSRVPHIEHKKNDPNWQLGQLVSSKTLQASNFEVADRIITIRLDPPVGVINLRVYGDSKTIKRDLLIYEPRLRSLMHGRRFSMTPVSTDGSTLIESVKKETVKEALDLIHKVGGPRGKAEVIKAAPTEMKEVPKPKVDAKPVEPAKVQAKPEPTKTPVKPQAPVPKPVEHRAPSVSAPPGQVYTPVTPGHIYEGVLKQAGTKVMTPAVGNPYEIFQAVLILDNGAELPLRGAELERELTGAECRVGDRVAIRPMGKVPVSLAGGKEGSKNLYQVQKVGSQKEMKA